jgi:acyl-CoA thioesterase YciA
MPAHANPAGEVLGGWIMASMDAAAGKTATSIAEGRTVTFAVSNMVFIHPVKVGEAVCFYTDVSLIGRTSIKMDVGVWVLRQGRGAAAAGVNLMLSGHTHGGQICLPGGFPS